jgi:hypothetical protein
MVGVGAYVYRSAGEIADLPRGVTTVTSTVPAGPAGAVTWQAPSSAQDKSVPGVDPKSISVAPVNPEPLTPTAVSPASGPPGIVRPVTTGCPATYVNWSEGVIGEVPPAVTTVTSTEPGCSGGEVTLQVVSEEQDRLLPGVDPKSISVAPVSPDPLTVTTVPPAVGPDDGDTPDTAGAEMAGLSLSGALAAAVFASDAGG